jgi:hypothetical protein
MQQLSKFEGTLDGSGPPESNFPVMSSTWCMRNTSRLVTTITRRVHTSGVATASESSASSQNIESFRSNPAFSATKVGNVWRKASVSPKNVARLMKEQGIPKNVGDPVARENAPTKPPKGHKVDRLKVARMELVEAKMAAMDARVAEYRKKKREAVLGQTSALDRLVMTKRQLRLKARNAQ